MISSLDMRMALMQGAAAVEIAAMSVPGPAVRDASSADVGLPAQPDASTRSDNPRTVPASPAQDRGEAMTVPPSEGSLSARAPGVGLWLAGLRAPTTEDPAFAPTILPLQGATAGSINLGPAASLPTVTVRHDAAGDDAHAFGSQAPSGPSQGATPNTPLHPDAVQGSRSSMSMDGSTLDPVASADRAASPVIMPGSDIQVGSVPPAADPPRAVAETAPSTTSRPSLPHATTDRLPATPAQAAVSTDHLPSAGSSSPSAPSMSSSAEASSTSPAQRNTMADPGAAPSPARTDPAPSDRFGEMGWPVQTVTLAGTEADATFHGIAEVDGGGGSVASTTSAGAAGLHGSAAAVGGTGDPTPGAGASVRATPVATGSLPTPDAEATPPAVPGSTVAVASSVPDPDDRRSRAAEADAAVRVIAVASGSPLDLDAASTPPAVPGSTVAADLSVPHLNDRRSTTEPVRPDAHRDGTVAPVEHRLQTGRIDAGARVAQTLDRGIALPAPAAGASALAETLAALAGQDWSGAAGTIISCAVFNAAMIPGWPPPRPFDVPELGTVAARAMPVTHDEEAVLSRFAERGGALLGQHLRTLLKRASARRRRRMLAALTAVMDTIDTVLTALEAELLLASRGRTAESDDLAAAGLRRQLTA